MAPGSRRPIRRPVLGRAAGVAALALASALTAPPAPAQGSATEYVSFWRGNLRLFATRPDTRVTILDVNTGLPLDPASWSGNFATNPFDLANAGDSFEATSSGATHRIHVIAESAAGDGEPKPLVAWTGWLSAALIHPPSEPRDENSWASYIPDVLQGVDGSIGAELGHEFLGFTSRDLIVFAQKTGTPVQVLVEDLVTNTDFDSDDNLVLDRTSPYLVHEDAEVEIYRYGTFEDDTVRITSNVPASVLAGVISSTFPDWASTPPSYGTGEGGRELGTLFYAFSPRWLTIMPLEDATTVTVTDLSDGDDTSVTLLANGDRDNPLYDIYVADPLGRDPTQGATPRPLAPAVTFHEPLGGPLEDDYVKISSDKPVLVQLGPIASDTNEFADVAYSVPTGPTSQVIYAYAQNGGANDFQMFSFNAANSVRITSLTYTRNFGGGHTDVALPTPTPFEGGNAATADWYWSSGSWGGELLRIESDWPVQVMTGDYDSANFGAFIPFVAIVSTRLPVADAGPDLTACPGTVLTLDGSASADSDTVDGGRAIAWSWDLDVAADSNGNGTPDDDVDATGPVVMSTFPPGTTVVKLTYTDDDGETDETFVTVSIEDSGPPAIDCPALVVAPAQDFTGGTAAPMATASDDCDPTPSLVNDRTAGGADATDFYPCGSTLVTFTSTDASGRQSTCATRVLIAPEGVIAEVGAALRVTKLPDSSPLLDWSLVGPAGPDSRFLVLRSETPGGSFPVAPAGGPLPDVAWSDGGTGDRTWYYDVRAVVCDGAISDD